MSWTLRISGTCNETGQETVIENIVVNTPWTFVKNLTSPPVKKPVSVCPDTIALVERINLNGMVSSADIASKAEGFRPATGRWLKHALDQLGYVYSVRTRTSDGRMTKIYFTDADMNMWQPTNVTREYERRKND